MKEEIIDLDFEVEKINAFNDLLNKAFDEKKDSELDNFEDFKEYEYNLDFMSQYMDLNEEIFEEIQDILDVSENKEWFTYSDALEQIREILRSRISLLDGILYSKPENSDKDFCL